MTTAVFVHGTGVREPAFSELLRAVRQASHTHLGESLTIEPCYWGESYGSKLFLDGISIPAIDTVRASEEAAYTEPEYYLALWAVLYDDAFAELDILALRQPSEEPPPGRPPPGSQLNQLFVNLTKRFRCLDESAAEIDVLLEKSSLISYFDTAVHDIISYPSYIQVINCATNPLADYRLALARAVVARSIQIYREEHRVSDGYLPLNTSDRDRIVELLVDELGGKEAGVVDWVKVKAGRLVTGVGTRWVNRRRTHLSDQFARVGADIMRYQTRPLDVRDFLRETVLSVSRVDNEHGRSGDVVLIAHSLGGVIAADTLIEKPLREVTHLVTVGSQVSLLYELDALSSLPLRRDHAGSPLQPPCELPDYFPANWLNIYDPKDFLSYKGDKIFGEKRIRDLEVDNGQPFPEAHSSYWSNEKVWAGIKQFLDKGRGNGRA